MIDKELIVAIFDKANGFGKEFGDWADYAEITPIREEFMRLIDGVNEIERKAFLSQFSHEALNLIDKEIKNENNRAK